MGDIGFEYWVVVVGVYWGLLDTGWFWLGCFFLGLVDDNWGGWFGLGGWYLICLDLVVLTGCGGRLLVIGVCDWGCFTRL